MKDVAGLAPPLDLVPRERLDQQIQDVNLVLIPPVLGAKSLDAALKLFVLITKTLNRPL